jgi:hypothetical protein
MKSGFDPADSPKEGHGSKMAVLPMMMIIIVLRAPCFNVTEICNLLTQFCHIFRSVTIDGVWIG